MGVSNVQYPRLTFCDHFYEFFKMAEKDSIDMTQCIGPVCVMEVPSKRHLKLILNSIGSSNKPLMSGCQDQQIIIRDGFEMATKSIFHFHSNFSGFLMFNRYHWACKHRARGCMRDHVCAYCPIHFYRATHEIFTGRNEVVAKVMFYSCL